MSKATLESRDFVTTIPFSFNTGHIVLPVKVNQTGKDYVFILDTGAPTTLSPSAASELGFGSEQTKTKNEAAAGDPLQNVVYRIPQLKIGDATYTDVGAVGLDMSKVINTACRPTDGIIGANVLNEGICQVNYSRREIRLTDNITKLDFVEKATRVKFSPAPFTKSPLIKVKINDSIEVSLLIDTGFNGSISFSMPEGQSLPEQFSPEEVRTLFGMGYNSVYGKGDSVNTSWLIRAGLSIGDLKLNDQLFTYGKYKNATERKSGVIGNDFLKNFIVTIDWNEEYVYLLPDTAMKPVTNKSVFGISYGFDKDKLLVGGVWKGSEAEKAGLAPGDEILSINGKTVSSISPEERCEYYTHRKELIDDSVDSISIIVRKGGSEQLYVLKRYWLFSRKE